MSRCIAVTRLVRTKYHCIKWAVLLTGRVFTKSVVVVHVTGALCEFENW